MRCCYLEMNPQVKIIRPLKEGGQKEVFLAEHKTYGNVVLKKGKCNSQASLERIKREVEILRNIESEHFPKNFEFRYDNDGSFEIVEELVKGKSLSECLNYFDSEEKVKTFGLDLIEGMRLLWDKRIVHRDLKPDNIIITNEYKPIIIDLGIARELDGKSLTKTIYMRGPCTPIYASPEQLQNKKNLIDLRSDFFSIGIILCEMLLKVHPFSPNVVGQGISIEENILNNRFKLSTEDNHLSKGMEQIILKMLQYQPFNRYRTYKQLQEALLKL